MTRPTRATQTALNGVIRQWAQQYTPALDADALAALEAGLRPFLQADPPARRPARQADRPSPHSTPSRSPGNQQ